MSGELPIVAGMAGRYATALFELAEDQGVREAVLSDLRRLLALIRGSADLARLLRSPLYSRTEQSRALSSLLDRLSVSPLTRQFVGLVAEKRRLFALADMIRAYEGLAAAKRGEIQARVTAAHPLSGAQVDALKDALKAAYRREIRLETEVDPRLLGGLVLKVGSRMIDSSLASKLERLRLALREA